MGSTPSSGTTPEQNGSTGSNGSKCSKGIVLQRFREFWRDAWNRSRTVPLEPLVLMELLEPLVYLLVPFQVPLQVPPENVPVIDRRSLDSVPVNV